MTADAQRVAGILQARERVRAATPAAGPGWSVCFKDAQDRSIALFSLSSYAQVELLADEVAALGYGLTVLDDAEPSECDFVFRETSRELPPVLSAPAHKPPAPVMPRGSRLPIHRGDLVMEDCGGPIMLVNALSLDLAYCVWFSEGAEMRSGTFTVSRLVHVGRAKRRLRDTAASRLHETAR